MSEVLFSREVITSQELLHRNLGRLSLKSKNGLSERNRFVSKFDWIPHWQAEVRIASRGLPVELKIIGGMPEPYSAARDTYNDAIKYWQESGLAVHQLEQALPSEDETIPSIDKIRDNFMTRAAMAKFSLAHRHFDEFGWHPRSRDKKNQIPNQITDARILSTTQGLANASDDRLFAAWFLAHHSENQRFNFWYEELMKVQGNPWVQEVQARNRARIS